MDATETPVTTYKGTLAGDDLKLTATREAEAVALRVVAAVVGKGGGGEAADPRS